MCTWTHRWPLIRLAVDTMCMIAMAGLRRSGYQKSRSQMMKGCSPRLRARAHGSALITHSIDIDPHPLSIDKLHTLCVYVRRWQTGPVSFSHLGVRYEVPTSAV